MRRAVESLLKFTVATGHEHPLQQAVINIYASMLQQMGYNPAQVTAELDKVGSPFGIQLGSGT